MKNISYCFSKGDIDTILFCLTVLPSLELESSNVQSEINYNLSTSVCEKLINQNTDISTNEFRIICAALQAVHLINSGELQVSTQTKKHCINYLFSVNKLVDSLDVFSL